MTRQFPARPEDSLADCIEAFGWWPASTHDERLRIACGILAVFHGCGFVVARVEEVPDDP